MKRRTDSCKTYGRTVLPSRQLFDFDKVCKNVSGNCPFSSSDSSAGRSMDLSESEPTGRYNLRKSDITAQDNPSFDGILNDSSFSQDTVNMTSYKPKKSASLKVRNMNARETKEIKKKKTRQKKKKDLNGKENSFNGNIPDYEDIAEDSFVVESEVKVHVTKCSTPVLPSIDAHDFVNDSGKMPTPIFRCLCSSKVNKTVDDAASPIENLHRSDNNLRIEDHSQNVTMRGSSKLRKKCVTPRKIVLDSDYVWISPVNLSVHQTSLDLSDHCDSVLYSLTNVHEHSSISLSHHRDDSGSDLLKSTGETINRFAAINLSPDKVTSKTSLPSQDPESSSIFNASLDLFDSGKRSHSSGLSFIYEENEELEEQESSLPSNTKSSLHSTIGDHKDFSESFYAKLATNSICEIEIQTAKEKLLAICEQEEYISFSTSMPPRMLSQCSKIGEGVYGEVFRAKSGDQNVAIKIIPLEGNFEVNDCPQKTFDELLPEAVIAKELSDLAHESTNSNFCKVNRISCVQGCYPASLLKEWDAYAKRKVSENDRPDIFPKDQLFVVFEFLDGGVALENYEMTNHRQTLSVLRQVVFALAVAESNLEFEHRDMHIGNILVRPSKKTNVVFRLHGDEIEFGSEGVFATIIDFTISRLKKDGCAVYCDISTDDGLFEGSGDIQFDVYRNMKKGNENDWSQFCPYSNILWVQYLCKKLLTVIKVKETGREHRESLRRLRQLNEKILNYESCVHLAADSELWEF